MVALALLGGGCEGPAGEGPAAAPAAVPETARPQPSLLDSGVPLATAEDEGWGFSQRAEADLDGDGQVEQVVLMARVELYQGRPAWDDGQVWQVYVEEPTGERTHLYARFVQLGTVTMRIGLAEGGGDAAIVLLEQLPDRIGVYELAYAGPGDLALVNSYQRNLDPTGEVASPTLP